MTETLKKRLISNFRAQLEQNMKKSLPQIKRKRYTFEEKQRILNESKILTSQEICAKYSLDESVFHRWKLSEELIENTVKIQNNTKIMKKISKTDELDDELLTWLSDCCKKGIDVSGPMLCQQALVINSRIGGSENFKASSGWFKKWKKRTENKNSDIRVEELSADEEAANSLNQSDVSPPVKKRKYKKKTSSKTPENDDDDIDETISCNKRKKRQRYSYEQKDEVLKALETQCIFSVSQKYKISEKLLLRWQKSRSEIETLIQNKKDVDEELFNWFKQTRNKGISVNGPRLREKALEINKTIGGKDYFKASDGWLTGWKNRFNVKFVSTKIDSFDVKTAIEDKKKFQLVKLPVKTFVGPDETQAAASAFCCTANADGSLKLPVVENLADCQKNAGNDQSSIQINPKNLVKVIKIVQPPANTLPENVIVAANVECESLDNHENEVIIENTTEPPVPKLIPIKKFIQKKKNPPQPIKLKEFIQKQKRKEAASKSQSHVNYQVISRKEKTNENQDIEVINSEDRYEIIEIEAPVTSEFSDNSNVIETSTVDLSANDKNEEIEITETREVSVPIFVPVPVAVSETFSLENLADEVKNTELPSGWNSILLENFLLIGHWIGKGPAKTEIHVYEDGSLEIFFEGHAITVPGIKLPRSIGNLLYNMKIIQMLISCDGTGFDNRRSDKCKRYVFCTKSIKKHGCSRCMACAKLRKSLLQAESRDHDTRYKLKLRLKAMKKRLDAEIAKNQKLEVEQARHRTSTDCNVRMLGGGTTQQIHALNASSAAAPTS